MRSSFSSNWRVSWGHRLISLYLRFNRNKYIKLNVGGSTVISRLFRGWLILAFHLLSFFFHLPCFWPSHLTQKKMKKKDKTKKEVNIQPILRYHIFGTFRKKDHNRMMEYSDWNENFRLSEAFIYMPSVPLC